MNVNKDASVLTYTYDVNGKLLSWVNSEKTVLLSYENENWPDLLSAFNCNLFKWHDSTAFTWLNGRRLASTENSDTSLYVSYTYNAKHFRK